MLEEEIITQRLEEMNKQSDPYVPYWPENCEGSRKALVIFVGPSPGGKKEINRRGIKLNQFKPCWNDAYMEPLFWSGGFNKSFRPIVETLIGKPYGEASKLIARVNMDWLSNPEAKDVSFRYMWEGCKYILPVIHECDPELVIPMDEKTFGVLQIALYNGGYEIYPARIGKIKIRISDENSKTRYHNSIMAFSAKRDENSFLVIKSLQHPARIFDSDYATRVGQSIRDAAKQIWSGDTVNLNI